MSDLDDGRYNKVANIIGHTMQYHPHGDASIGDALVQFAYWIAMPALLFATIAQEPVERMLEVRFLLAFGGDNAPLRYDCRAERAALYGLAPPLPPAAAGGSAAATSLASQSP